VGLASLKRLATVVGAAEVGRSLILDDVLHAWQPCDRARVVPVDQFLFFHAANKLHAKKHEKDSLALCAQLDGCHAHGVPYNVAFSARGFAAVFGRTKAQPDYSWVRARTPRGREGRSSRLGAGRRVRGLRRRDAVRFCGRGALAAAVELRSRALPTKPTAGCRRLTATPLAF
jgi:hypothetical protein